MNWFKSSISVTTHGKGLVDITDQVDAALHTGNIREGLCVLFIQHCSASLVIQESYDPSARRDMEVLLEKVAPEAQPWMIHTLEGSDDSSAHLRAMLLPTSLTIPIDDGKLSLGTWQGVYLVEHRRGDHRCRVLLQALDMA
ncbi:MAG: YjbQ family protein [Anaerolineae bacterium]|nr:YjbQ family protein [Anaerolineae bacterium]